MRIAVIAVGSRGDVQPHIALAVGLQAAGHDVRVVTHTLFEKLIRQLGLDFFPLAGNPRDIVENEMGQAWLGSGGNSLLFFQRFSRLAEPLIQQVMLDCWNACQDLELMVFSPLALCAASSVAEKLGVPYWIGAGQPLTPTVAFPSPFFPAAPTWLSFGRKRYNWLTHTLSARLFWQLIGPLVNKARGDILNLPEFPGQWLYEQMSKKGFPILYYFSPSVLPLPADWSKKNQVTGYWFLEDKTDWQPPTALVDFLAAGPAPVYVGFGSMNTRNPEEMTEIVVRALVSAKQRGILVSGWGGTGNADLPDEVFKIDAVPHSWLFPQMAAVVHHGGAGTMAASLWAGVPSVMVPFFGDQPFWGRRYHALGIIPEPVPQKRLTVERLADAIKIATSDTGLHSRVGALSERIRAEDGVGRAVDILQGN
jgi:sterol 3beta-glucosyltransferase